MTEKKFLYKDLTYAIIGAAILRQGDRETGRQGDRVTRCVTQTIKTHRDLDVYQTEQWIIER